MIAFPNCKINIGLHILSKRSDGYHSLESLFYPLPFCDVLEIVPARNEMSFKNTGLEVGPGDENLCYKAYQLMKDTYDVPPLHIHLHKNIPAGAGLGGGSSDAAFTLSMINDLCNLKITKDELFDLAAVLGSDCPFFIENKPVLVSGRGEVMHPISFSLKGCIIVLIVPPVPVSTSQAYAGVKPAKPKLSVQELAKMPFEEWKANLGNDFEKSVMHKFPQIMQLKNMLYGLGAVYASMSGSGSAVYGIFEDDVQLDGLILPHHKIWKKKL